MAATMLLVGCGAGNARTDSALCRGVRIGEPVMPTLTVSGSPGGPDGVYVVRGSYRYPRRHDVCAEFGPPTRVRELSGGTQVWIYGPGTTILNFTRLHHRIVSKHSAGTVTFDNGQAVSIKFASGDHRPMPIGG
jgi:hypothetical protein